MVFEILKAMVVLAIAVPFIYIIFDVVFDITSRIFSFLRRDAKPILLRITSRDR